MDKIFIRVTPTQTEELICAEMEKRGYKEYNQVWLGVNMEIIIWYSNWEYYNPCHTVKTLLDYWYKEVTLDEPFLPWELVGVSHLNQEDADTARCVESYVWILKNGIYVTEYERTTCEWKYIAKVPKQETIKITTTDWQELEITKEKAKEIWFIIK